MECRAQVEVITLGQAIPGKPYLLWDAAMFILQGAASSPGLYPDVFRPAGPPPDGAAEDGEGRHGHHESTEEADDAQTMASRQPSFQGYTGEDDVSDSWGSYPPPSAPSLTLLSQASYDLDPAAAAARRNDAGDPVGPVRVSTSAPFELPADFVRAGELHHPQVPAAGAAAGRRGQPGAVAGWVKGSLTTAGGDAAGGTCGHTTLTVQLSLRSAAAEQPQQPARPHSAGQQDFVARMARIYAAVQEGQRRASQAAALEGVLPEGRELAADMAPRRNTQPAAARGTGNHASCVWQWQDGGLDQEESWEARAEQVEEDVLSGQFLLGLRSTSEGGAPPSPSRPACQGPQPTSLASWQQHHNRPSIAMEPEPCAWSAATGPGAPPPQHAMLAAGSLPHSLVPASSALAHNTASSCSTRHHPSAAATASQRRQGPERGSTCKHQPPQLLESMFSPLG